MWDQIKAVANQALVDSGSTITHHHAVGKDHVEGYVQEVGLNYIQLLRALKRELDPANILNPGILIPQEQSPHRPQVSKGTASASLRSKL
jgi:alkyldihydroxyacetonephosphate synthase